VTLWIILLVVAAFAAGLVSATLWRRVDWQSPRATKAHADGGLSGAPNDADQVKIAGVPAAGGGMGVIVAKLFAREGRAAAITLAGLAVVCLAGLYASIELPELTQAPASTRTEGELAIERLAALTGQQPNLPITPLTPGLAPEGGLASVDDMIERLVERLKKSPNDPDGWRMLGWSYFNIERFAESAAAYLKAIALRPTDAAFRSLRGEALVKSADGVVTPEAARAFDEALELDSAEPRARFFKGLAKEQAGEKTAALDDLIALLNDADPAEPWYAEVKQSAARLGQEIGADVSGRLRSRPLAASGDLLRALAGPPETRAAVRKGPNADEVRAAEALAPVDRNAMVRGMVERLAARLEQSPRDIEGWIQLMRSRVVLGETDRARQAMENALVIFSDASQERDQITAAARELGVMR
jgi:cytochrome c-type biogenesis protein CcmH